jgi:hypothetical protein
MPYRLFRANAWCAEFNGSVQVKEQKVTNHFEFLILDFELKGTEPLIRNLKSEI